MASRHPITCHVLDTTTGRPARSVLTTLTCASTPGVRFTCATDSDGRIAAWEREPAPESATAVAAAPAPASAPSVHEQIEALVKSQADGEGNSVWTLRFETARYYGAGKTFWPAVELTFFVRAGEHFHVPLLLGPYSYTTYRGS
jgi:5-hydroxyisourate hydrolase